LATALKAQHAAGGLVFAVALLGWYLVFVQLLASVDFPLNLPVGDLSGVVNALWVGWRGRSMIKKSYSNKIAKDA
jgi:hypothetical protein